MILQEYAAKNCMIANIFGVSSEFIGEYVSLILNLLMGC